VTQVALAAPRLGGNSEAGSNAGFSSFFFLDSY